MAAEEGPLSWWYEIESGMTACYHEPKVHDHKLYFQLAATNLFLILPLGLLGLVFNTAALICLHTRPKISSGVFIYLKALLLLDNCHIATLLATNLLPTLCDRHFQPQHLLYKVCMFEGRFLRFALPRMEATVNILHVWTLASLATHRYWKVSHPVVARLKDTPGRARSILYSLYLFLVVYRLPTFLAELHISKQPSLRIERRPESTQLLSPYRLIYHSLLDPLASNMIPFAWMSVFSALTLRAITHRRRPFTYGQLSCDSDARSSTLRANGQVEKMGSTASHPTAIFTHWGSHRRKRARRLASAELRQKADLRATLSILFIIVLYLLCHSLQLYSVVRKWQLLWEHECPTRQDYVQSHISTILSMLSATVNAFVFIAFINRLRLYVLMWWSSTVRPRTSRSLSSNTHTSEPPISPRSVICFDPALSNPTIV